MNKPDLKELNQSEFFDLSNPPFDIQKHLLFACISGSNAYGVNTENSDVDVRGVIWLPENYLLGLLKCEQIESAKKDITYFAIKKFFQLCIKGNVHSLEMAYMPQRSVKYIHPAFQKVLDNRNLFLSSRIGFTFGGYAYQQCKLMFTKKANNTGRQELINKYSFDVKMGMHCLRILRSGRELLETGHLNVYREKDREELLAIRNGKYKLHEMAVLGKNDKGQDSVVDGLLAEEFKLFYKALDNNNFPKDPPFKEIESLLINLQREFL